MNVLNFRVALQLPLWVAGLTIATAAHAETRSSIDLSAGVGASTNPLLQIGGKGSAFGRISALGMHEWRSERTSTTISLYGENTTYLRDYGSKQVFDLTGRTVHQVNPNLTLFGDLGFQGDFAGQLSSRFASATPIFDSPPPDQPPSDLPPPPPPSTFPPQPIVLDDPNLFGFGGRQYRLHGQVGLSMRSSERSSISLSVGAQRSFGSGRLRDANFNSYFGNAAWNTQWDARTTAGIGLNLQYQDYDNGGSSSVLNPYVTGQRQFSDHLTGTASAGLLVTHQNSRFGGSSNSISPSFSFSLCNATQRDRLCARGSRQASNTSGLNSLSSGGTLSVTTTVAVDYSRQLDSNQSIQLAVSANRYSTRASSNDNLSSTYLNFLAGYDRKLGQRLAAGVNVGARKLMLSGTDPKTDFSGNVFIRYRLGDLQ